MHKSTETQCWMDGWVDTQQPFNRLQRPLLQKKKEKLCHATNGVEVDMHTTLKVPAFLKNHQNPR